MAGDRKISLGQVGQSFAAVVGHSGLAGGCVRPQVQFYTLVSGFGTVSVLQT